MTRALSKGGGGGDGLLCRALVFLFILGEIVGTKGAGKFLLASWMKFFYCSTLWIYAQNPQNFVENSKMGEKHKKRFDPNPTSGSDLG